MIDINTDVSNLTSINTRYLNKITEAQIYSIAEGMQEVLLEGKNVEVFDIGIGLLAIQIVENEIRYKFTPGKRLETAVHQTILEERNLLEFKVEQNLVNRIARVYKDLM